jgi:Predicted site-specific integrase-resolvase
MKLSNYAKNLGITYKTAWNHYRAGLVPNARQLPTGIIIVEDDKSLNRKERTAVYARVSSSMNKSNLVSQSKRVQDFCAAKGWGVAVVVEEIGSGLNDNRKKLNSLLLDKTITRIVVEHKDRLTRFGATYIKSLWNGEIVVINEVSEDEKDLMQDFVSLVTSLTARLYGRRRSRRLTEKLIAKLKEPDDDHVKSI